MRESTATCEQSGEAVLLDDFDQVIVKDDIIRCPALQIEDLLARRGLDYALDTITANDWKRRYDYAPELQRQLRGPLRLRSRRQS